MFRRKENPLSPRPFAGIAKRIASFAVIVGATTIIGLITIPSLVSALGARGWAELALVQSVSQLVGILVAFGWGATGPSMIAGADPRQRPRLYVESIVARSYLYLIGFVIASVALIFLTRGNVGLSVLGSATYLLQYLGASWYFVGEARPWRMFFCDSLPGLLGTLFAIVGVLLTHSAYVFLVIQLAGLLCAAIIDAVVIMRESHGRLSIHLGLRDALNSMRGQTHAVSSAVTSGVYVYLPVLAVQTFFPPLLPLYVMADRLYRYAAVAFSPIQQFLQGWVPEAGKASEPRRMRIAAAVGLAFGIAGGLGIAVLSPFASSLLTHGAIVVPFAVSSGLGVAFVAVGCSAVIGYACLVLLGRVRSLAVSTIFGAVAGAPLIILFAVLGSAEGVAWSVAVSEVVVAGYQALVMRSELNRRARAV